MHLHELISRPRRYIFEPLFRKIYLLVAGKNAIEIRKSELIAFPMYMQFEYNGKILDLFEHDYNCGYYYHRMSERCLEIAIAIDWLNRVDGEVLEIGAVTPRYFPALSAHTPKVIKDVCDPHDDHPGVNLKCSLFDLDLTGKNILSISTIEHIATGDYGVEVKTNENPVLAFQKMVQESSKCLITFPVGYNKMLDTYFAQEQYADIKLKVHEKLFVTLFVRNKTDNKFTRERNMASMMSIEFGPMGANAVVVIEKY